jgi:hypothetical protein
MLSLNKINIRLPLHLLLLFYRCWHPIKREAQLTGKRTAAPNSNLKSPSLRPLLFVRPPPLLVEARLFMQGQVVLGQ